MTRPPPQSCFPLSLPRRTGLTGPTGPTGLPKLYTVPQLDDGVLGVREVGSSTNDVDVHVDELGSPDPSDPWYERSYQEAWCLFDTDHFTKAKDFVIHHTGGNSEGPDLKDIKDSYGSGGPTRFVIFDVSYDNSSSAPTWTGDAGGGAFRLLNSSSSVKGWVYRYVDKSGTPHVVREYWVLKSSYAPPSGNGDEVSLEYLTSQPANVGAFVTSVGNQISSWSSVYTAQLEADVQT